MPDVPVLESTMYYEDLCDGNPGRLATREPDLVVLVAQRDLSGHHYQPRAQYLRFR